MAIVVLLLSLFTGLAFAGDEDGAVTPTAGFLPSGINSPGELDALTQEAESVKPSALTVPQVAEELPHSDLTRDGAEELLQGVFGEGLEVAADFYDELEVQAFHSNHVALVGPADGQGNPGLVSSLLPLRAENQSGDPELVDLDLERNRGALEPENPLVEVQIPTELSAGIDIPGAGVTITVANGDTDRTASDVGDASAFFPNVRTDSDLVVSAIPTGVETYTHLRSPDAPTTETFDLTIENGGQLRDTVVGGAEVVGPDGGLRLSVAPPSAIDAEGTVVPASLEVAGNSLVVTAHPPADAVFPILLDPVFENYNFSTGSSAGLADWSQASNPGFRTVWNWPQWGMNAVADPGATSPGNQATWNYYVPRYWSDIQAGLPVPTTYIERMNLWNLEYRIPGEAKPYATYPFMQMGLWSDTYQQFVAYGYRDGSQGELTDDSYTYKMVNPNQNSDVKHGGFAIANWNSSNPPLRYVNVGQAWVEITDKDNPAFGELGSVPEWVSTKEGTPLNYKATDPGIGIHSMRLEYTKATGIKGTPISGLGCTGNAANPCPRTVSKATKQIPYYPNLMPQGENWINVYAVDAVNHWSEAGATRIKVDRSKPELSTTGTVTEQAKVGVNLSEYSLELSTVDGDEATAAATTPIATAGTGPGQLERPMGVAVDSSGNSWVTDRTNQRVIEYDGEGKLIREINKAGSADGQLNDPRGVAVGNNGNIWVAEAGNKRIQQFSPTGGFVSKFTNAAFVEPWGLAVAPDGSVWVADHGAKKVFLFKTDGTLLQTFSSSLQINLGIPVSLDIDEFGNAWVASQETNKVYALTPTGETLLSFGGTGTEAGKFNGPVDVAIAPSGNIFVLDDSNARIQEFRPGGLFMRQFGTLGSASSQLKEPRAIDATGLGNELMVADAGNKRIARWSHADRHPESGTVKTEIKVDGVLKDLTNPGCAEKNCKITRKWTLEADEYSVGTHTVEAIATDGVGLQTKKTFQIETHGDLQAPQLALSGTMIEQATVGTTLPTYKIKAVATDTGSSSERKSGVASTSIKVDGVLVDSSSPGCPSGGCSITREWSMNSSSYSVGSHFVEVKATDAAGRSTAKFAFVKIDRDSTAPELTLSGTLPTAPEGWVQQESRSATAVATDPNGYGVKQIRFLIDGGVVGESAIQTCEAGGCQKTQTFSINMANFEGGAHPAVMTAEDLAGNVRKKTWTINVDPEGHISINEATETLEALDLTSPVNTVGEPVGDADYEGTTENLYLDQEGGSLVSAASAAPTTIPTTDPGAVTIEIPTNQQYADCPNRPIEESEAEFTGEQEEELAQTATCFDSLVENPEDPLEPISVTGTANVAGESQALTANDAAVVANNVSPHVDLVTRPLYDGAMIFSAIRDSAGAETFSWRVNLAADQTMQMVDPQSAKIVWNSGPTAFVISAVPAHDAVGTSVPTHLSVSGDILTLTVEHRATNYVYPVVGGAGWEGGFQTYQVSMPAPEGESGEFEGGTEPTEGYFRELTIGPPEPTDLTGAPLEAKQESTPPKKRNYNFHDCRFNPNGYDGSGPPGTPGNVHREGIHRCHGEEDRPEGGYWTLAWAVSIHGSYRYIPHKTVWINVLPECKKWGPEQPAKRDCKPNQVGVAQKPNLDVLGYYRFAPGNFGGASPQLATCYRLNGVLPNYWKVQEGEEPAYRVLEETMHPAQEKKNENEKCTWSNLKEID